MIMIIYSLLIQILDEFLLMHPTLEFLHVDFCYASYYVPLISDSVFKMSKLRVLLYDIYDLQSAQNRQRSLFVNFNVLISLI